eukprot:NODE_615_length_1562_cov_55.454726_g505_i0.p1 GENE.NODE_615_length_1562_cov_55.454726_g505_i0~~NODE_615_length_1562_cov_55.454726_g505_i0.p1  ORF type:complete len:313 (+),score=46.68 NODE_615_length_1562_cov_55.454726_g505_i0:595-1533(+)
MQLTCVSREWDCRPLNFSALRQRQIPVHGTYMLYYKLHPRLGSGGVEEGLGGRVVRDDLGADHAHLLPGEGPSSSPEPRAVEELLRIPSAPWHPLWTASEPFVDDAADTRRWPLSHFVYHDVPSSASATALQTALEPGPVHFSLLWTTPNAFGHTTTTSLPKGAVRQEAPCPVKSLYELLSGPPQSLLSQQGHVAVELKYPKHVTHSFSIGDLYTRTACEVEVALILTNHMSQPTPLEVVLQQPSSGFSWIGKSKRRLPALDPAASLTLNMRLAFWAVGVYDIRSFIVTDVNTHKSVLPDSASFWCTISDAC